MDKLKCQTRCPVSSLHVKLRRVVLAASFHLTYRQDSDSFLIYQSKKKKEKKNKKPILPTYCNILNKDSVDDTEHHKHLSNTSE